MDIKSIDKIRNIVFFLVLFIMFNLSCQKNDNNKKVKIDFSRREDVNLHNDQSGLPLKAAVSAMISPEENFFHYNHIFDYISARTGRKILFKQRKTYQEVNELLSKQELDFAFICSGAYIEAKEKFEVEILAIPQVEGNTYYRAYIIVQKDSNLTKFEDLKGHSFAFTDPLSNTGFLYPNYLVKKMNKSANNFFSRVIYTYAHDFSIQAVVQGLVDGASIDGLIFNYLKKRSPEKILNLRIIKISEPFGMPPIVIHSQMEPELKRKLRSILFNMNSDPRGKEILTHLAIDRFVLAKDSDYNSVRELKTFIQRHESQNYSP